MIRLSVNWVPLSSWGLLFLAVLVFWAAASPVLAQDASKSPIIVMGDKDYPPYESLVDGEPVGINVDLWREIAKILGRPLDMRLNQWADSQERVQRGEAKLLTFMSINKQRAELYDFTSPTFTSRFPVFVHAETADQFDVSDLTDKRIAVKKGGFPRIIIETIHPEAKMVFVESALEGFRKLLRGEVDGVMEVERVGYNILRQNDFQGIRATPKALAVKTGHIAVVKGNLALLGQIDEALKALKESGKFDQIVDKWSVVDSVLIKRETIRFVIILVLAAIALILMLGGYVYVSRTRRTNITLNKEIIERKQAEERLFELNAELAQRSLDLTSAHKLAKFTNWTWNKETDLTIINPETRGNILPLDQSNLPQEFEGHGKYFLNIDTTDRERLTALYERVDAEGLDFEVEYGVIPEHGKYLRIHERAVAEFDDAGKFIGHKGTLQDITEIWEAQNALRDSVSLFRVLATVSPIGIFRTDAQGLVTYVNDKWCEITGLTPEDSMGDGWFVALHPDDSENVTAAWEAFVTDHSTYNLEYRYQRQNGEITYCYVQALPETDEDGRLMGYIGCLTDITERKQMEDTLRLGEKRMHRITDELLLIITYVDADLRYRYANKRHLDWHGLRFEDIEGKTVADVLGEDAMKFLEPKFAAVFAGETVTYEADINFATFGARYIQATYIPDRDPDGKIVGVYIAAIDLTDRKQLELQLRHSQRMDAMGQLTGGVAHDFNNLLAVMIGNAELLVDSVGEDEDAKHSIEAIKSAVERGASLTSRLLAFSRKQMLSPVTTDVTTLVGGLLDMLHRTLGETIDLRVEDTQALWAATIDPHQFENALVNLALNARDAMPRGGTLTIRTANITLDETYAEQHQEVTPGDYVEVSVSDTGTGIAPEVLEKVFEPFFTTKEVGKSSGLGLSMVFGFIKQSGGHIVIYSEVDRGTTVKLFIPRSEVDLAKEGTKDATREIARGSERILLIEDDEHLREVPVKILRKQGYEVVEAADGKEAIKHLQDSQPFDLLFTDVVLPGGMSGFEIVEGIKRLQPDIKVLYTSGYAESAIVPQEKRDLKTTLLMKPYSREKLLEKVRATLDSKSVLLIDDDTEIRTTLMNGLKRSGYSVTTASGGKDGLKSLKSEQFDVVVTDVVMQDGEGVETLGWIKQNNPDIPVIGISGHAQYLGNLKKLGAAATLMKPFTIEELIEAIRDVTLS